MAEGRHSTSLLEAIAERERELHGITATLLSSGQDSGEVDLGDVRMFITQRLTGIRSLLYTDLSLARTELCRHVSKIRMRP